MRRCPRSRLGARTGRPQGPSWLRQPTDPNALVPHLWSPTAHKVAGELTVGGVALTDLVAEHGTPAYVLDEADFRARARAFRDAFADVRRLLRRQGVPLHHGRAVGRRGGPLPRRLLRRRADRRAAGRLRPGADRLPRQQQDARRAAPRGGHRRRPDHRRLLRRDRAAGRDRRELGRTAAVMVRVTAGVEAHTHEYIATAHEDQKFGFSITCGDAFEAVRRVCGAPGLELLGLHSHIGTQIFDSSGFEVAARRVLALHARISDELGVDAARDRPRRRLRHRLHDPGRPVRPRAAGDRDDQDRRARVPRARHPRAAAVDRARPRDRRPADVHGLQVGTVKEVALDGGAVRTYVSVDGGMSDNIRTALYDADYSCTLASRRSDAPPVLARVVGKHCEAGDIVVKDEFLPGDVAPRRPGGGARHRCLLPLDGLQLQPRAAAAGGRGAGRCRARRRAP